MTRARSKPRVALVPLGCDKNTVDGEKILGSLLVGGYEIVETAALMEKGKPLDLLVVNTCAFIGPARDESMAALDAAVAMKQAGRIKRIAVSGCFGPLLEGTLPAGMKDEIDHFVAPGEVASAYEVASGRAVKRRPNPAASLRPSPRVVTTSGHAFVKIAEGCDRKCSFCTIPSLRGKFVSRPISSIVAELSELAGIGIQEAILVSQDTGNFGRDRGSSLLRLLKAIEKMPRASRPRWIRLHYLYPNRDLLRIIEAVADSECIVPYFDIPIQHASPAVLKLMRRPTDLRTIEAIARKIRAQLPESAIRTTVITGHPGETAREFTRLLEFVRALEFDRLGVIPYSPEPGTRSAGMKAPGKAVERAEELMALQAKVSAARLKMRVGRVYDVLMDSFSEGRTMLESPNVDGVVRVKGTPGAFVRARIVSAGEHDLEAKPL